METSLHHSLKISHTIQEDFITIDILILRLNERRHILFFIGIPVLYVDIWRVWPKEIIIIFYGTYRGK